MDGKKSNILRRLKSLRAMKRLLALGNRILIKLYLNVILNDTHKDKDKNFDNVHKNRII